jgi:hypothetical protein
MDKLVKRVTVVQGSGDTRHATVVYEDDETDDSSETAPLLQPVERAVRHMLKADVIMAQEAYERFLKSSRRGRIAWLVEAPTNIFQAQRKAYNEGRKAVPFGLLPKVDDDKDDEDEGD